MDGRRKEETEQENGHQALVNTAEHRTDFLLYLGKVFFFFKLCSLKCYVLGVLQGPLSRLGLMRQNTALSRDGKVLSVCSIDAPRERSFVEKMDYF